MFDAMDVGIIGFLTAALIQDWNMTHATAGWIGTINAIGMFFGAIIAGVLADRIGRMKVLTITIIMFSISSGLSALSTSLAILLVLRFFMGLGLGGEGPVAATIVAEHAPSKTRGRWVVLLESFWAVGWLLAAIIGYFVIPNWGWRAALLIGAIPAFIAIYIRRGVPESATFNKMDKERTSVWGNLKTLWTPKYARATTMTWILWLLTMFTYYGMFLWFPSILVLKGFDLIRSFGYVLIMTLAQLPGFFSAAWLIEKIGRKFVLIGYLICVAISSLFFGNAETVTALLASGLALNFFFPGVTGTIYAYATENYAAEVRATGSGMANALGRIGSIIAPVVVGGMMTAGFQIETIFILFFSTCILAALNVLLLGKETRGQTEETEILENPIEKVSSI
ncbi:MFS transporter [Neobacillus mesonae]|uniref:MFS transporter n=1 Tax=Neobacillus mesonae TaxID=1193713 RepID=UPI000836C339|nr:MFS transporter [Neobacillus mesonae]